MKLTFFSALFASSVIAVNLDAVDQPETSDLQYADLYSEIENQVYDQKNDATDASSASV